MIVKRESSEPKEKKSRPPSTPEPAGDSRFLVKAPTSSSLTEKLIIEFCKLVAQGLPGTTTCDFLGISYSAFHAWITKGTRYLDGGHEPKSDAIYGAFVLSYRKALAGYCIERLTDLHDGDNKDWYKSVVILERRDRKNWSKNEPLGGSEEQYDPDDRFL